MMVGSLPLWRGFHVEFNNSLFLQLPPATLAGDDGIVKWIVLDKAQISKIKAEVAHV